MNDLKGINERQGQLVHQQTEIMERAAKEGRIPSEDENLQYKKMDDEYFALEEMRKKLVSLHERGQKTAEDPKPEKSEADQYREAFENYVRYGKRSEILEKQFRTTQSGQNTSTTTGGYLIPTSLGDAIVKQLYQISPMLNFVTTKKTAGGGPITYPTRNDTSNKGHWLAEETQAAQTLITFGQKTLNAWTLVSDIIPVSFQALQDASFDFGQEIGQVCGERLALGLDYALIQGNGTSEPNGLEAAATVQGAYFAKSAITRLVILDLIHSINVAYRNSPSCKFVMADSTLKVIKKLAISSNDDRSLWQPNFATGDPGTIEGFGYVINDGVDAMGTAANKPMYFGDLSQYYFRMVGGINLQVFNERYADFLQRGFMMWMRCDGELMNTTAVKHAICAAT